LKEKGMQVRIIHVLNSDQSYIQTCVSCEMEYSETDDTLCCSANCRIEVENIKATFSNEVKDDEIREIFLSSRVVDI